MEEKIKRAIELADNVYCYPDTDYKLSEVMEGIISNYNEERLDNLIKSLEDDNAYMEELRNDDIDILLELDMEMDGDELVAYFMGISNDKDCMVDIGKFNHGNVHIQKIIEFGWDEDYNWGENLAIDFSNVDFNTYEIHEVETVLDIICDYTRKKKFKIDVDFNINITTTTLNHLLDRLHILAGELNIHKPGMEYERLVRALSRSIRISLYYYYDFDAFIKKVHNIMDEEGDKFSSSLVDNLEDVAAYMWTAMRYSILREPVSADNLDEQDLPKLEALQQLAGMSGNVERIVNSADKVSNNIRYDDLMPNKTLPDELDNDIRTMVREYKTVKGWRKISNDYKLY